MHSYRLGRTCAVQFHPEMGTKIVPTLYVKNLVKKNKAKSDAKKYGRPAMKVITNFEKML